jgi:hypothetical protein
MFPEILGGFFAMGNPNPVQTDAFKAKRLPKYGDRPLAAKVVGTRYQQDVDGSDRCHQQSARC